MDPATVSALLAVSVRLLEYLASEDEDILDDEMLAARKVIRKALVKQARGVRIDMPAEESDAQQAGS